MKPYTAISIMVLTAIALAHVLGAIAGVTLTVGDVDIPALLSWPLALVFGLLALTLWVEASE